MTSEVASRTAKFSGLRYANAIGLDYGDPRISYRGSFGDPSGLVISAQVDDKDLDIAPVQRQHRTQALLDHRPAISSR
jgi:hypothetical protein